MSRPNESGPVAFSRPHIPPQAERYLAEALQRGDLGGSGPFSARCVEHLRAEAGSAQVLLTKSCTHALELAALLLDLEPGDEVIMPSYTFVSTANAFALRGARPVFVDVRSDTVNLDESLLEDAITDRTRAIVPVHYAGVPCEMDPILRTAAGRGIAVVEDAAHALFARYRGRPIGGFGTFGAYSFDYAKNFSCGEGGALCVNDARFLERAHVLHEKGTDRTRFLSGVVDKYTWRDIGSNFAPSELLASLLQAQFESYDAIQRPRAAQFHAYAEALATWAESWGVQLPVVPSHVESAHHLFHMVMPHQRARDGLMRHLRDRGILAVTHYEPLHLSDMGRRVGRVSGRLTVTERMGRCLVRLPLYPGLPESHLSRVIDGVREFVAFDDS